MIPSGRCFGHAVQRVDYFALSFLVIPRADKRLNETRLLDPYFTIITGGGYSSVEKELSNVRATTPGAMFVAPAVRRLGCHLRHKLLHRLLCSALCPCCRTVQCPRSRVPLSSNNNALAAQHVIPCIAERGSLVPLCIDSCHAPCDVSIQAMSQSRTCRVRAANCGIKPARW